jgi:hypothetical protein
MLLVPHMIYGPRFFMLRVSIFDTPYVVFTGRRAYLNSEFLELGRCGGSIRRVHHYGRVAQLGERSIDIAKGPASVGPFAF